jgi:hypothetical protein
MKNKYKTFENNPEGCRRHFQICSADTIVSRLKFLNLFCKSSLVYPDLPFVLFDPN